MINILPYKSKITSILLCFTLLMSCILMAQDKNNQLGDSLEVIWQDINKPDSVRYQAINKFYVNNTFAHPDSVLVLTDYHYDLAVSKQNEYQKAMAFNEKSYAYYVKGDTKTSMKMLQSSIAILEKLDNPLKLATIYSNLGNIYGEEDKYQEAVRYFTKSLKIFQDENLARGEARMLNNLGIVYLYLDNETLTLDYLNRAIEKYLEVGQEETIGSTLTYIATVYFNQGLHQKALVEAEKSLKLLLEQNNRYMGSSCYLLLARIHNELGNSKKAFDNIEKGIAFSYQIENTSRIIETLTFRAKMMLDTDLDKAIQQAEYIEGLIEDDTENQLKADLYEVLYSCYKRQQKFDLSLQMHEKYLMYRDSVQKEKNAIAIIEEAIQSEFDEKLIKTKLDNEKKQAALKLSHVKKLYALVAGSIISLLLIILFFRSRMLESRKKRQALLEEVERMKQIENTATVSSSNNFELTRANIESKIERKLNETDWKVLNILLEDPVISNKEIAQKVFMSVDGIGSSLRRMYEYFQIKESKYKKISLLMEAIKLSKIDK